VKKRNPSSDVWLTPMDFWLEIKERFTLSDFDPCPPACDVNEFDGLKADWADRTYCNPPYSQKLKENFIHKAHQESLLGKFIVMLLPVSTSTVIFHELILPDAKVEFIKGRLPFEGINTQGEWVNPRRGMAPLPNVPEGIKQVRACGQHDSMLVIFGES
jgi:hypothetical protein